MYHAVDQQLRFILRPTSMSMGPVVTLMFTSLDLGINKPISGLLVLSVIEYSLLDNSEGVKHQRPLSAL